MDWEVLMRLLSWSKNYFYTKTEDKELFHINMEKYYYYNGVVNVITSKETIEDYYYPTRYDNGYVHIDENKDVWFANGELDTALDSISYEDSILLIEV